MQVVAKEIPEGSFELRFFFKEDGYQTTAIDLVLNLNRVDDKTAEVSGAFGDMSNETNIAMGFKALELGFTHLQFHVLKGQKKVTRFAQYERSDDLFDYYSVDLEAAAADFMASHHLETQPSSVKTSMINWLSRKASGVANQLAGWLF